jgi:hypothetical protein
MPRELGVRVFDVIHEILVGNREQASVAQRSPGGERGLSL